MNKYNMTSTNEIEDYKNNEIFIKTKKDEDNAQATNTLIFVNKKQQSKGKLE